MGAILSAIMQVVGVLKALISLWNYWLEYQAAQKIKDAEKKRQDLEKAINDSKKAETDEEIWDAQKRIVDTKSL